MASSYYKLDISNRADLKSRGAKKVRKSGFVPGVLYYAGEKPVNISIQRSILFQAMQSGQRIFEIDQGGKSQFTMIKQIQYHPVSDEIIHVDLMRVRRSEKISISVPIVLVGESVGVKEGGVLSQSLNQVDISCYPTDVPENIELNIEDLELNSAKNVADLNIELDDVDITSDPTLNIVSVTPPAVEEEASEASVGEDEDSDVLSDSKEDATVADKEKSSPEEDSDDKNESS